jgi:hypothetical protein
VEEEDQDDAYGPDPVKGGDVVEVRSLPPGRRFPAQDDLWVISEAYP